MRIASLLGRLDIFRNQGQWNWFGRPADWWINLPCAMYDAEKDGMEVVAVQCKLALRVLLHDPWTCSTHILIMLVKSNKIFIIY